jgi:hypothetical protein
VCVCVAAFQVVHRSLETDWDNEHYDGMLMIMTVTTVHLYAHALLK